MIELNLAGSVWHRLGVRPLAHGRLLLEDVPYSGGRREGALPGRDHLAKSLHRPNQHGQELEEGYEVASANLALQRQPTAVCQDAELSYGGQEEEERPVDRPQARHFHVVVVDLVGDLPRLGDLVLLATE